MVKSLFMYKQRETEKNTKKDRYREKRRRETERNTKKDIDRDRERKRDFNCFPETIEGETLLMSPFVI